MTATQSWHFHIQISPPLHPLFIIAHYNRTTMNQTFLARFPQQLKHWSFHCIFNAMPSFIIASVWMKMYRQPACIAAMLLAIACFIFTYATLTSLPGSMNEKDSITSRSIRLGAKIRTWMAGISIPFVCSPALMWAPDFWCGMFSVSAVNWIARTLGHSQSVIDMDRTSNPVAVFATTLLEGTILSIILLKIAFFCLIILQIREQRKLV